MISSRPAFTIAILILAFTLTPVSTAAQSVTLEGATGETANVSLMVESAEDLGAFDFEIQFDPEAVKVSEVGLADFLGSTGRNVSPLGPKQTARDKVKFAAFSFGEQKGPSGTGVLAVVTFEFLKGGSTEVELAESQLTDIGGSQKHFPLALNTNVTVRHLMPLVARRYVLASPAGLEADQMDDAVTRLKKLLHPNAEEDGENNWAIVAVETAEADEAPVPDGTLIVMDSAENVSKAGRFLESRLKADGGLPGNQTLWTLAPDVADEALVALKQAGLSEKDLEEIGKRIEAGTHIPLGFGLELSGHDDVKGHLVAAEVQRIKKELPQEHPSIVVGLPAQGALLVLGELDALTYLETDVLHTLPAGGPNDWEIVALHDDTVWVRDTHGYVHEMQKGVPHASKVEVLQVNEDTGKVLFNLPDSAGTVQIERSGRQQ